jgi:beta-lactamase regulating signal transducer with metallopeptidase domain
MIPALTVLASALAAGWLVPALLRRIDLRRRDPALVIVAWLLSMAGAALTAATGVLLLLLPGHGGSVLALLNDCWLVIQHGSPPEVEKLTGLLGVVLLCALAVRVLVVFTRGARLRARKRQESYDVLRLAGRAEDGPPDVLWLAHATPLAFSMAGRPGVVVVTDGLNEHLRADEVAAVFAHERAHLAGRHHLLVAIVDALRVTLPFVPLFRAAPSAIRDLVELAADTAAVRTCGRAAVRTALLTVTRHGVPSMALPMAHEAVDLRIARLRYDMPVPGRARRVASCVLAALTALALPLLTGAGLLAGLAAVLCPS